MRFSIFFLALGAMCGTAAAGIDFTPGTGERKLSGVTFSQLIFKKNGQKVTYEQPMGWTYSGSASGIKFTPPNIPQAQAEIEQSHLPVPQAFDEPTIKALQQKVLSSVPGGSKNVSLVAEDLNPFMVNGHQTYGATVEYEAFGQQYRLSILFLNMPDTQLRFRVTARKQDFEKVHTAFRGTILSFQGL